LLTRTRYSLEVLPPRVQRGQAAAPWARQLVGYAGYGVAAITASSYLPEPKPLSAKIPWSAIHLKVSSKSSLV